MLTRVKKQAVKMVVKGSSIGLVLCSFAWSQLATEDLLSNAGFDLEDNLNLPVDWKAQGDPAERGVVYGVDKENKKVGDGALMVTVGENGNSKDALINQGLLTQYGLGEKIYCKAWVRYKNVSSIAGYQLVIHQAKRNSGPPWYETIKWSDWFSGAGSSEEWHQVEGSVDINPNANSWTFRVYLRKDMMPGCTVWVDNIELSTEPVSISRLSASERAEMLSVSGNTVQFTQPSNYEMQIYTPNGRQFVTQSGRGTKINLIDQNLAAGRYIVKIHSEIGSLVESFSITNR